jgi:hypothetical protein
MAGYAADPERGDFLIHYACTQAADPLPLYRVVYKFYNRQRRFDLAGAFASRALEAAALRCGLPAHPGQWNRQMLAAIDPDLVSQMLLALKAQAFVALRQGTPEDARLSLDWLAALDPEDGSGASVVSALADSLAETA